MATRLRRHTNEPLIWGKEHQPSYHSGRYHLRARARFYKIRLRIPAGETWQHLKGFDIEWAKAGLR